jgi:hypothetical protein
VSTEQTTTPDPAPTDGLPPYSDDLVDKALSYVDQRGGSAARAEVILATEVRSLREVRTERNALRAELARVRPVVDAARAWKAKRDGLGWPRPRRAPVPEKSSITEAADLHDAVAALDGDAAATPAARCDSDEVDDCSCGAAGGSAPVDDTAAHMAVQDAIETALRDAGHGDLPDLADVVFVAAEAARASSAPPVEGTDD